jgi:hypothetical protein
MSSSLKFLPDQIHIRFPFRLHCEPICNRDLVLRTLGEKCAFKGIPVPDATSLANSPIRAELESEWENMLAHQLPEVPSLQHFFEELRDIFDWLTGALTPVSLPSMPFEIGEDTAWQPPAMVYSWGATAPLETIRFAAANRLCVDLSYQGSCRLIEPYSLRRTKDGNIILHAVRRDSGEARSYRIDRIEGASATKMQFEPRYAVELTPSGYLPIPNTVSGTGTSIRRNYPPARPSRRSTTWSTGYTYIIQCMYCGRRFSRKTCEISINPHKDKSGYPCPGRSGFLVETKY